MKRVQRFEPNQFSTGITPTSTGSLVRFDEYLTIQRELNEAQRDNRLHELDQRDMVRRLEMADEIIEGQLREMDNLIEMNTMLMERNRNLCVAVATGVGLVNKCRSYVVSVLEHTPFTDVTNNTKELLERMYEFTVSLGYMTEVVKRKERDKTHGH